jgi:cytochrome c oxidase subunit II
VLVGIAFGSLAAAAQDRATTGDRETRGRQVFMEQGCHGCHTVNKLGTPIGPDLSHVGAKYSEAYLRRWLQDSEAQRPSAHMPRLELTDGQIALLAAFLKSLE